MHGPEGNSESNDSRENKTNLFPEGPYIKCFVIYLDFPLKKYGKNML